ncbi:DgyrCDS12706 [Dimorphilus gyrociliatus]|uniref:DgyrCDS12706 n=1 Tax=Dimorphilus gyrociliatus TaxID=2664684 RepID=A0A7I8W7X3_9ANNE|nr:DgyrCDS12706 [Dimorphilus gyrociliatus]
MTSSLIGCIFYSVCNVQYKILDSFAEDLKLLADSDINSACQYSMIFGMIGCEVDQNRARLYAGYIIEFLQTSPNIYLSGIVYYLLQLVNTHPTIAKERKNDVEELSKNPAMRDTCQSILQIASNTTVNNLATRVEKLEKDFSDMPPLFKKEEEFNKILKNFEDRMIKKLGNSVKENIRNEVEQLRKDLLSIKISNMDDLKANANKS